MARAPAHALLCAAPSRRRLLPNLICPTRAPVLHLRTSRRRMVVELMKKALRDDADA
jgi:hypothetical protein